VILDVPPVLGLPESKTVTDLCDGIVFIVRADRTSQNDVEAALDVVARQRLLGVVFNGSGEAPVRYRYDD
jgi:Mrp family chromosome partitioning ATPase